MKGSHVSTWVCFAQCLENLKKALQYRYGPNLKKNFSLFGANPNKHERVKQVIKEQIDTDLFFHVNKYVVIVNFLAYIIGGIFVFSKVLLS